MLAMDLLICIMGILNKLVPDVVYSGKRHNMLHIC